MTQNGQNSRPAETDPYDAYEDNMLETSGSLQWNTNKEPGGNNSEIET